MNDVYFSHWFPHNACGRIHHYHSFVFHHTYVLCRDLYPFSKFETVAEFCESIDVIQARVSKPYVPIVCLNQTRFHVRFPSTRNFDLAVQTQLRFSTCVRQVGSKKTISDNSFRHFYSVPALRSFLVVCRTLCTEQFSVWDE